MTSKNDNGYILEFYKLGNSVKVTAIDPLTGKEATIITPLNLPQEQATKLAIQKLEYMLGKGA
jgi:hypothetical protein